MAEYTPNLNLIKPEKTDVYDIGEFNDNATKIDDFAGSADKRITSNEENFANYIPTANIVNNTVTNRSDLPVSAAVAYLLQNMNTQLGNDLTSFKNKIKVSNNLGTIYFSYDGVSTVFIDWNITTEKIIRIAFDNNYIRQLWTSDGGNTWATIWTK